MNNRHLRALIVRLQDRLSEDDRKRLHFFLGNDVPRRVRDDPSLGGTLCLMESLFDQDKINEDDFTFLINAFDEIQCLDAVKLLREHMMQMQSNGLNESVQSLSVLMPPLLGQILKDGEEDKFAIQLPLINQEIVTNNKNVIINSNNNTINSETITAGNQTKIHSSTNQKQLLNKFPIARKYFILSILSLIIQVGVIIGGCVWIIQSNMENRHILNKQIMNNNITKLHLKDLLLNDNDTIHHLKILLSIDDEKLKKLNEFIMENKEAIKELTKTMIFLKDDLTLTEGTTCGCSKWCYEHGSSYGVCGDGPTCICKQEPIKKKDIADGCRCEAWCQRRNHTGGRCGDGFTCICSS